LALNIDPSNAPRMHLFAWNVFLGARDTTCTTTSGSLTELLSQTAMEELAAGYFEKVHPCYGFIDCQVLSNHIQDRWKSQHTPDDLGDAILYGVAALGYLFSHVNPPDVEVTLVQSAKAILERSLSETPSITSVTAWLLRVIYLRIAGTPHAAWITSCTLMHMMEAAGLHCEPRNEAVLQASVGDVDPETRRRIFGVAQHLNTWISFDVGRSKVTLLNTDIMLATPRQGDYTIELLELLPYSAILDPSMESDAGKLETTLRTVLDRVHAMPPSALARCNLVLCLCRRLRSLSFVLKGTLLDQVLGVTAHSIQAARDMVSSGVPWHHMANVPFQILCILLSIDTPASTSQLKSAMTCLSEIAAKWRTTATQEALKTASLLIFMYKKQKERSVASLEDILRLHPVPQHCCTNPIVSSQQPDDLDWLDNLVSELPTLQDIFNESVLIEDFPWNIGSSIQ
jgi:hypothetical protein